MRLELLPDRNRILAAIIFVVMAASVNLIYAQENIDVGETGWHVKRPVMASACDNGN